MLPEFDMTFWRSFWPSLISGMANTVIFSGILIWAVKEYRKPKLKIEVMIGHHAPSSGKKTLMFNLINEGHLSLESNGAHCKFYLETDSFKAWGKACATIANNNSYHVIEVFNEKICHPGAKIKLAEITVELPEKFPYEWIDESPIYVDIYTSKGHWRPGLFNKHRKDQLRKGKKTIGYRVINVVG